MDKLKKEIIKRYDAILDGYASQHYRGEDPRKELFDNPLVADYFNNIYKELTGKNHPRFMENHIFFCQWKINEISEIYDYLYTEVRYPNLNIEELFKEIEAVKLSLSNFLELVPENEWKKVCIRLAEPYSKEKQENLLFWNYGVKPRKQFDLSVYQNGDLENNIYRGKDGLDVCKNSKSKK